MPVQIVILAGGVGGSRFVAGARRAYPQATITVIVNTADDITLHGLRICPDLDTMMYNLGGASDMTRGWGRAEESWRVRDELVAYGAEPSWFGLGDLDLATHLVRTEMLAAGHPLSQVTEALCERWLSDPQLRLVPMSNDRVETHVVIADERLPAGRRAVHFQEYWVRMHAEPAALEVIQIGSDTARATPGLPEAIGTADLILVAPSNPVVSIGPILGLADLQRAVVAAPAPVVGFAGIVAGAPVLGMAHRLLPAIDVAVDAGAVGTHYGARSRGGVLDSWIMDNADAAAVPAVERAGLRAAVTDLIMHDPDSTATFIRYGVEVGEP
jgi:LPPG:FO 2-phospho-L-lactate transferase